MQHSKNILNKLKKLYPEVYSELNFKNDYQLLVSVILSAQCTDKKVNEVTPSLFKEFKNFKTLSLAKISTLEKILRPINYYKTKSKNLKNLGKILADEFKGKIPETIEELIQLPGVGRKTASVVQSERGIEPALAVDTHVFRVSKRLGIASGKDVREVEEELKSTYPKSEWRGLHHRLIFHGRRICKAQKPLCEECTLNKVCKFINS